MICSDCDVLPYAKTVEFCCVCGSRIECNHDLKYEFKNMTSDVYGICNSYESGFGHGYEIDNLPNPYKKGTDEYEAYQIGYENGSKERQLIDKMES